MSEAQEGERDHDPSERRLREARARGEVVRSVDVTTAAAYAGFLLAALAFGPAALHRAGAAGASLLAEADRPASLGIAGAAPAAAFFAMAMLPLVALPAAAALVALVAQGAFTVTPDNLLPRLSRLSPLANLRHKLGPDGLAEFAKGAAKLALMAGVLAVWVATRADAILATLALSPSLGVTAMLRETLLLLGVVVAISAALAAADYLWQWLAHRRRNRMSRQEVVEEHKDAEGDPQVKAQRRQRGHEIATNRMLVDVGRADVVIVNPTHFAVALRWDRTAGQAPVCVAKGVDAVAARIRARAAEAGVPLHRDPPTARLLHAGLEIGQEIRPEHYKAVAAAIRFAEAMRRRAGSAGRP